VTIGSGEAPLVHWRDMSSTNAEWTPLELSPVVNTGFLETRAYGLRKPAVTCRLLIDDEPPEVREPAILVLAAAAQAVDRNDGATTEETA